MKLIELKQKLETQIAELKHQQYGFDEAEGIAHQEKIVTLESVLDLLDDKETKELEVGNKGWIISPSTESEGYNDNRPRRPWYVQVVEIQQGKLLQYKVCAVSDLFANGIDEDSNATAYVKREQFFLNKNDAEKAYVRKFIRYLKYRADDLFEHLESLENFINNNHILEE